MKMVHYNKHIIVQYHQSQLITLMIILLKQWNHFFLFFFFFLRSFLQWLDCSKHFNILLVDYECCFCFFFLPSSAFFQVVKWVHELFQELKYKPHTADYSLWLSLVSFPQSSSSSEMSKSAVKLRRMSDCWPVVTLPSFPPHFSPLLHTRRKLPLQHTLTLHVWACSL